MSGFIPSAQLSDWIQQFTTPESFFFDGPNGWKLHGRHWKIPNAKATVIGVPGYSEHSGCYAHFAKFLNENECEVIWLDLPGQGLSEGRRNNIDDFADYLRSFENFLDEATKRACVKPWHLFAHSLGALISTRFLETSARANLFERVAFSSPLFGLARFKSWQLPFVEIYVRLISNSDLPSDELGTASLSHDRNIMQRRENDPIIKSRVTPHWLREMLRARKFAFAEIKKLTMPIGFFLAGDERVTNLSDSKKFYERLECVKSIKIYDGFLHELVNEVGRAQVMNDVLAWLGG